MGLVVEHFPCISRYYFDVRSDYYMDPHGSDQGQSVNATIWLVAANAAAGYYDFDSGPLCRNGPVQDYREFSEREGLLT